MTTPGTHNPYNPAILQPTEERKTRKDVRPTRPERDPISGRQLLCLDHIRGTCAVRRLHCRFIHAKLQDTWLNVDEDYLHSLPGPVCGVWATTGHCKFGKACKDQHPPLKPREGKIFDPVFTTKMSPEQRDRARQNNHAALQAAQANHSVVLQGGDLWHREQAPQRDVEQLLAGVLQTPWLDVRAVANLSNWILHASANQAFNLGKTVELVVAHARSVPLYANLDVRISIYRAVLYELCRLTSPDRVADCLYSPLFVWVVSTQADVTPLGDLSDSQLMCQRFFNLVCELGRDIILPADKLAAWTPELEFACRKGARQQRVSYDFYHTLICLLLSGLNGLLPRDVVHRGVCFAESIRAQCVQQQHALAWASALQSWHAPVFQPAPQAPWVAHATEAGPAANCGPVPSHAAPQVLPTPRSPVQISPPVPTAPVIDATMIVTEDMSPSIVPDMCPTPSDCTARSRVHSEDGSTVGSASSEVAACDNEPFSRSASLPQPAEPAPEVHSHSGSSSPCSADGDACRIFIKIKQRPCPGEAAR